jgi:CRP-like cAMP-binding protein
MLRNWFFKLERFCSLTNEERDALQGVVSRTRVIEPHQDIVSEGGRTSECNLVIDGFAAEYLVLPDGSRQIMSFRIAGDFCGLESLLTKTVDHDVAALARTTVAVIPHEPLLQLAKRHPPILFALWQDTLLDAATNRAWIANIGRRSALARIAHLLCELCLRLRASGLARGGSFELPLTQTDVGDATGLSVVHVNRTLQKLRADGLISWRGNRLVVVDQQRLEAAGGFASNYLKLSPADP